MSYLEDYADILSVNAGRIGGGRDVQSIIDDYGHYIDIDQLNADSGESGDRAAASGYEGLDLSTLTTPPQRPQRSNDYDRLGARDNAASAQRTEVVEVNTVGRGDDYQNTVS